MEFQALITWHIKFQAEFTSPGFLIEIFLLERNYFGWSVGLSFSKCIYIVGVWSISGTFMRFSICRVDVIEIPIFNKLIDIR